MALASICYGLLCAGSPPPTDGQAALQRFQQGDSVFIENQGQWNVTEILFALDSHGVNVGLTAEGPRFQLFRRVPAVGPVAQPDEPSLSGGEATAKPPTQTQMHPFAIQFVSAKRVTPVGERKSKRLFNYRRGEQAQWRESVPSWETVIYHDLYDGIDLRLMGRRAAIKYEFIAAPGADWQQIQLHYDGIQKLELKADGTLAIHPAEGWPPVVDASPVVYQVIDGQRQPIAATWQLLDEITCTFSITGKVDSTQPLVIDPTWQWGPGKDHGRLSE